MKTIYQKISLILFLGFLCQMFLFGIFYKHVVTNRIITEINYQENKRQIIIDDIIDQIQKNIKKPDKCKKIIQEYSKKI